MNRRDFVKTSFLTLAAGAGMPGFLGRTANAAIGKGKILVVVQLSGGNDALNTLIPFTNGAYYNASDWQERRTELKRQRGLEPSPEANDVLVGQRRVSTGAGCGLPQPKPQPF